MRLDVIFLMTLTASKVVKNLSACAAYGPDLVDPASALKASNRLQHQTSNRAVQLRPRFLISKKAEQRGRGESECRTCALISQPVGRLQPGHAKEAVQ